MKRFLRKALIGLGYTLAILLVLLILFYAEEDWRGARDWSACQKELAAKGESLDLRQLAPPGKKENDLSKLPFFTHPADHSLWFGHEVHTDSPVPRIESIAGKPVDLKAWQDFYRSIGGPFTRNKRNPRRGCPAGTSLFPGPTRPRRINHRPECLLVDR